MVDGVGCTHPSSALHHPDIHGPADHRRHCEQEGAQAEGKWLREENPTPTLKNANTFAWGKQLCLVGCSSALMMSQGANKKAVCTGNLSEAAN